MNRHLLSTAATFSISLLALFLMPPAQAQDDYPLAKRHQYTGTIQSIDADAGVVNVEKGSDFKRFTVGDKTWYSTREKKTTTIADFDVGDAVTVYYTEAAGALAAHRISLLDRKSHPFNPSVSGTGFFITEDGFLLTNWHVVNGAAQIRLLTPVGILTAKVARADAANDLALLKADGKFAPLAIAPSTAVRLGSTVATIGFPDPMRQGFAPKEAKGEIASLFGIRDDPRYFQISLPVQHGNSGGALVDEQGNVVGIVSEKLSSPIGYFGVRRSDQLPENVNYAIKSSYLLSFLDAAAPTVSDRLKKPTSDERKFEDVVESAKQATVQVLVEQRSGIR